MKFSKILALTMAVLMVCFCFAACTSEEPETVVDPETETEVEPEVEAETEVEAEPEVEDDTLVMATNAYFQPYEYYEGDKVIGIDDPELKE